MDLKLYHSGLTTCSKQVRHQLREKEIPYESCYVELWRYENLSPSYLSINPNGVVPTLVHNGKPIINSFCIMEYVEDVFPERPLRPHDPLDRARSRYWAWTADEVHLMLARLTHAFMLQAKVEGLSGEEQQIMLANTPVPEKRERWQNLTTGGYSPDQIQSAVNAVLFKFQNMEKELEHRGPWLAGDGLSLGDIAMLAIFHRITELFPDEIKEGRFPRLNDWWARAMKRPAAKFVYTDGLEETPRRPQRKSIDGIANYRI
ncbi:MAG: glutathione S-transferase family protein [Xanthobacteraceae bacterium]